MTSRTTSDVTHGRGFGPAFVKEDDVFIQRTGWYILEQLSYWTAVVSIFLGRLDVTVPCIGFAIYAKMEVRDCDRSREKRLGGES